MENRCHEDNGWIFIKKLRRHNFQKDSSNSYEKYINLSICSNEQL